MDWSTLIISVLGSGSIIYLLIDKLILSKGEKVDAASAQSTSLQSTIEQLRQHNTFLQEQLVAKDQLIVEKDKRYVSLTQDLMSVKADLFECREDLQYYMARYCKVKGCSLRTPPSVVMDDNTPDIPAPTKFKNRNED